MAIAVYHHCIITQRALYGTSECTQVWMVDGVGCSAYKPGQPRAHFCSKRLSSWTRLSSARPTPKGAQGARWPLGDSLRCGSNSGDAAATSAATAGVGAAVGTVTWPNITDGRTTAAGTANGRGTRQSNCGAGGDSARHEKESREESEEELEDAGRPRTVVLP